MKQRTPKNWKEAIEDTIELHKEALKRNMGYSQIKESKNYICPLCLYNGLPAKKVEKLYGCDFCVWVKYTGATCNVYSSRYKFHGSQESIIRLTEWLEKESNHETKNT